MAPGHVAVADGSLSASSSSWWFRGGCRDRDRASVRDRSPSTTGVADNADPTSLATVARQDLSSQTQVPATLGYAGSYSVVNQAQGTVTALPAVGPGGQPGPGALPGERRPGRAALRLDPRLPHPVRGAWRRRPDRCAELNADLVALGYATSAEIPPAPTTFTYWTKVGVEKLQAALGVTQTGTLALGPGGVLAHRGPGHRRCRPPSARPAQPGQPVLTATSTTRQVSIALDAAQQSEVAVGDKVTITLPNNQTTPG